jgi:cobalamin biosynthesis Co2+ chelatase CbiK
MSQHEVIFPPKGIKLIRFYPDDKTRVIDYATVVQILAQEFPGVSPDKIVLFTDHGTVIQACLR